MDLLVFIATISLCLVASSSSLQRFDKSPKKDGSLSFLVIGDWGRKGTYNQTKVADQDVDLALNQSRANWKIVVGHHTIKSAGEHGVTNELEKQLLPILELALQFFNLNEI
ncbi:unnamed protein product [Lupinus luteus]|uniref:Acid phosphatase n=1 Tax=Lupinus luteus TaxID=3873 RepID=A0AAV1Y752_LUPLU